MDDPKKRIQVAEDMGQVSMADLVAALRAATGNDEDSLRKRAEYEAEAHKRLNKRENEQHPGISAFSTPEGDLSHPKDPLKCKMTWVGYPVMIENQTPREIAALNRATPGELQFTKTDGSTSTLSVTAKYLGDGSLERLEFFFPCRGDHRHNLPGMTALLTEVFGGQADELSRLRAERDALLKDLERITATV